MKSVMKHNFSQVPSINIPRSVFDRSHGYKTTFDSGYLVPFYIDEALPGDTFSASATLFARMSTPIVPVMDNVFLDTFYFAVPIRLIWENWQRFNGEVIDPNDEEEVTDFLVPQIDAGETGFAVGSLSDYFGLPVGKDISVSSLWHRAYNLIWNEWFRDENLQSPAKVNKTDVTDVPADYPLRKRGKRHDYFTSCLPWPQKGPGVELPLSGTAPVYGDGYAMTLKGSVAGGLYQVNATNFGTRTDGIDLAIGASYPATGTWAERATGLVPKEDELNSHVYADMSEVTAATINSLREAFQLQRMLEKDARGGTRYTEIIRSHFGVISPDSRLQRPEYLGGSSDRIHFAPVQQTSSSDTTTPQGNLAAYAVGTSSGRGFHKSFTEHCVIIGMVSVRADLTYQDGIPRMFSRQTRYDYYWPTLAHLGEQAVLNKEIYAQGTAADEDVFGYQERYAEYRYFPSKITGKFRSAIAGSLDVWHLSQEFEALPELNDTFIEENPPINRLLAVKTEPEFLLDTYISLKCARPMPVYSVPGLIDHF